MKTAQNSAHRDKEIQSMKEPSRGLEEMAGIMGMIPSDFQIMVNFEKQWVVTKDGL